MAKSANQKMKLLYLMKILLEQTDENHPLSIKELADHLAQYDIHAERKSLYSDLESLRIYGIDIERAWKTSAYYVASRTFELPELKLLVDAVQASRFITRKKSNELIHKVEQLASVYEARQLQRQVFVSNRVKTVNESIYYNIDQIYSGIAQGLKIGFLYFRWVIDYTKPEKFQREFRKEGKEYYVSPWALTWDDENYYLVAYDSEDEKMKHYRVDKMIGIKCIYESREGETQFERFDIALYTKKMFSMYGGEEESVVLAFENGLIGVVIDQFGQDVSISKVDEDHFAVRLSVVISPPFWGWLMSFGKQVKILKPEKLNEEMKMRLSEMVALYPT